MTVLQNSRLDTVLMSSNAGVRWLTIHDGVVTGNVATGLAGSGRYALANGGIAAVLVHRIGKRARWRSVLVLMADASGVRTRATLKTPIPATDVIWFDARIVICGESEITSRAWIVDPFVDDPIWHPLEMPGELESSRKGFDAMVSNGRHLVVIDNMVLPKYMVEYRASRGAPPCLCRVQELAENGTHEHVRSASGGKTLFAVHSITMGRSGGQAFLTLYRHSDLARRCVLELRYVPVFHAMQDDDLLVLYPDEPGMLHRHAIDRLREPKAARHSLTLRKTQRFAAPFDRMYRSLHGWIVLGTHSPEGPFEVLSDNRG